MPEEFQKGLSAENILSAFFGQSEKRWERMEKTVDDRFSQFDAKLDKILSVGSDVAVLKAQLADVKSDADKVPGLSLKINSLETHNKILYGVLGGLGGPVAVWAIISILQAVK